MCGFFFFFPFFLSLLFFSIRCQSTEITPAQCGRILLSYFRGVKSVKRAMKPAWRSWKNLISLALGKSFSVTQCFECCLKRFPLMTRTFLGILGEFCSITLQVSLMATVATVIWINYIKAVLIYTFSGHFFDTWGQQNKLEKQQRALGHLKVL